MTTTTMLPQLGDTILVRTVPYEVDILLIAVRAVMDTKEPVFCPGKSFEIDFDGEAGDATAHKWSVWIWEGAHRMALRVQEYLHEPE
jgi:hypothetical protein